MSKNENAINAWLLKADQDLQMFVKASDELYLMEPALFEHSRPLKSG